MSSEKNFDAYHVWLQIPSNQRPPTHYQMLGLQPGESNPEVIRQATLMRSAYVRHFQTGEHAETATAILEQLQQSMLVLTDPSARKKYDESLTPKTERTVPAMARLAEPPTPMPVSLRVPRTPPAPKPPKAKKTRRKASKQRIGLLVSFVISLAVVGGTWWSIFSRPTTTPSNPMALRTSDTPVPPSPSPTKGDKDNNEQTPDPPTPDVKKVDQADVAAPSKTQNDGEVIEVSLTVNPSGADVTVAAEGSNHPDKAKISGTGVDRKLVAPLAAFPIVLEFSSPGYESTKKAVFSFDSSVVIRLRQDHETQPATVASPNQSSRRPFGPYRTGISLATKDFKPVWKFKTYSSQPNFYEGVQERFDDSGWDQGEGAFSNRTGKGAGNFRIAGFWSRTSWTTKFLILRTKVQLPKPIETAQIRWRFRCDDNVQIFVNGRPQFFHREASHNVAERLMMNRDFRAGDNTVAVGAVNTGGPGLVDVGFDWVETVEIR
jgi:hypothetical protein